MAGLQQKAPVLPVRQKCSESENHNQDNKLMNSNRFELILQIIIQN